MRPDEQQKGQRKKQLEAATAKMQQNTKVKYSTGYKRMTAAAQQSKLNAGKKKEATFEVLNGGAERAKTAGFFGAAGNEAWRFNRNGSRKTFDQLSNAEVLTWISTLDPAQQASAAADFEKNYLHNPGSARYDPYYTQWSNNEEARQMFGVDTFDQKWIDDNRGLMNYLTFTNESYSSPKKPGANASEQEKMAYQYWQIANTYEATTQAAESEYAKLREEIQQKVAAAKAMNRTVTAAELLEGIDWSEYETLENLRETAKAGNGRYLNRPVQVGDASLQAMVNAAIRGEDVTDARDYVMAESDWIKARPERVKNYGLAALGAAGKMAEAHAPAEEKTYYPGMTSTEEETQEDGLVNHRNAQTEKEIAALQNRAAGLKRAIEIGRIGDKQAAEYKAEIAEINKRLYGADYTEREKAANKPAEKPQTRNAAVDSVKKFLGISDGKSLLDYVAEAGEKTAYNFEKAFFENARLEAPDYIKENEVPPEEGAKERMLKRAQTANDRLINALKGDLYNGNKEAAEKAQYNAEFKYMISEVGLVGAIQYAENKIAALNTYEELGMLDEEGKVQRTEYEKQLEMMTRQRETEEIERKATEDRYRQEAEARQKAAVEKKVIDAYGSYEVEEAPDEQQYNTEVATFRKDYGLTGAMNMVRTKIRYYSDKETYGTITEAERAYLAEWKSQLNLLLAEESDRKNIAERTRTAAEEAGYASVEQFGLSNITRWLWNRNYEDALRDGENVPLEDYEEYLRYRLTPGEGDQKAYAEMAKYDQMGRFQATAGAVTAGVAEGVKKLNFVAPAVEEALYWAKSRLQYPGMTREEIYAADADLNGLRAFNRMFEGDVLDEQTRQTFNEQYPGLSFISAGIGELIKMGAQADMSGNLVEALGGMPIANRLVASAESGGLMKAFGLQNLPFGMDAFTQGVQTARNEGATDDQTFLAGMLNAVIVGPLSGLASDKLQDLGGSITRLLGSKKAMQAATEGAVTAAKNGWTNALLSLIKSAATEGAEEAMEEPIQSLISKSVYDQDRAWLGEGGVFDAQAMLESGLMGAALGSAFTVMSGVSGALGKPAQKKTQQIVEEVLAGEITLKATLEELAAIEAREAGIQERTEELKTAAQPQIEAAAKEADAAREQTSKAEEKVGQANDQLNKTLNDVQPTLTALNEGTLSLESPEAIQTINEAAKKAAAEKDVANQARAELAAMQQAQQAAEQNFAHVQSQAHEAARTEATAQVDQEIQQEKKAARQADINRPVKPGVQMRNKKLRQLTPEEQAQINVLDALGREYGIEFDVVDSIEGGKANAAYNGGKRISVALDAAEGAYLQAGTHELVHYVKAQSGDGWAALEAVVVDQLAKQGFEMDAEIEKRIDEYRKTGRELDREGAIEEIVAEAVPTIFSDEKAAARLVERNATLAESIRDFIRRFAQKLDEIVVRYVDRLKRSEIAHLYGSTDALYEIAATLDGALEMARDSAPAEAGAKRHAEAEPVPEINEKLSVRPEEHEAANEPAEDEKPQEHVEKTVEADENPEDKDDARRLAKKITRDWKSLIDRSKLVDGIWEIAYAYRNGETENAESLADELARTVIEKSRSASTEHRQGYEEIRKRLRESEISLTDTQMQEVKNKYGKYGAYRNGLFGSVKLSKNGISLDSLWGELSAMHPEMFPADTSEAQMPEVLAEFVQRMKPQYENPYGMGIEEASADLSMRMQAEILKMLGRGDEAKKLTGSAESLREKNKIAAQEKRARQREEQLNKFKTIAHDMAEARRNGDDNAVRTALRRLRENSASNPEIDRKAEAVEIGVQVRRIRTDVRRITQMITRLNDDIQNADYDGDRNKLQEEEKELIEMRDQLNRLANRLHRQEAITRAEAANAELTGEEMEISDSVREMIDKILNQDTSEALDEMQADMYGRIQQLKVRVGARGKLGKTSYNMMTTLTHEELTETFEDLEDELIAHAQLAKTWAQKRSTAEVQKKAETDVQRAISEQLKRAEERGDQSMVQQSREQLQECNDRIDALQSQIKEAKKQESYNRRMGAESIAQAMREGRLPQPIMERVIALVKESGRRGKLNNTAIMRSAEALRLNSTTASRVWDDLFGDASPLLRAIYFDQVMDNEAQKQTWIKEWREKLDSYRFTQKESEAIQKIGEGAASVTSVQSDLELTEDGMKRIMEGVKLLREFYDESYRMAKRVLTRNGYDMGQIPEYFPHFELPKTLFDRLGIPMEKTALPTSINGLTDTFSPGHRYSAHLQQRKGDQTDYDALYGFEEYIRTMSDVIFHTDDIQRHRQLESEIRAASQNDPTWPDVDVHGQTYHANEFVKWLHEYANSLAGKKGQTDRGTETAAGRTIYALLNRLKSIRGASAVMGNLSSAITNAVPITQISAEHPRAFAKAVGMLATEGVQGRQNRPKSQFMIRRFGSDSVIHTAYTTFSSKAGKPFDIVDHATTSLVVHTYFLHNLEMGMDNETAMRNADAQAARLMGDRSKGALPNIYEGKILGFFTQFQLEVANQSQHFRKDIWREHGTLKGLVVLFMTALFGNIWNHVNEQITGRRSAADPLGMVWDMYQAAQNTGEFLPVMQACFNNISEIFPYMGGGRIAATENIFELGEALSGGTWSDIKYAAANLGWSLLPMGGQLKKTKQGVQAMIAGGNYSASGEKLYYPLDIDNPWTWTQAILFGKSATQGARDYYSGEAPALTAAQTRDYKQSKERGASSTEAYRNEATKAAASRLQSDAEKAENAQLDAEAKERAGYEAEYPDLSEVESQKEEAANLRKEAFPGDELSDYWWKRKDTKAVQNGVELWRETGDNWALPYAYSAEKSYTIDKRKEYLGEALAKEAEAMYEQGYMEIMEGIDPAKMTEEEKEELKEMLEDLYADVNSEMKARIKKRNATKEGK